MRGSASVESGSVVGHTLRTKPWRADLTDSWSQLLSITHELRDCDSRLR